MADATKSDNAGKPTQAEQGHRQLLHPELIEVAEAVVLALVAVATAWSSYHAARWNGEQASLYATATRFRVEAAVAATEGGQQRLLDVVTFNTWIEAHQRQDDNLATLYVHRISPAYRSAFEAWLKTEPFARPNAPAGPLWMPEYRNALLEHADELNKKATDAFAEGTEARNTANSYVRITLVLATVLFLVAIAQRFKLKKVRGGLFLVAAALMFYALASVATYPRL
jgi:hypothetical protein